MYPLIGTKLPSEGKGTARGTPFAFCTTFQKSPVLLNVPPLFSPSIKINLAHFFFMLPLPSPPPPPPPPALFLHDRWRHWKKGTAHREILQKFLLRFVFSRAQSWLYWKKLVEISYFNKKECPTASKINDSVCYCIDDISLLYLPKIIPRLCPPSCQICPLFNFVLFPFRCGLFSPSYKPLWENQNCCATNKLWVLITTSPFHTYHLSHVKMLGLFEI